MANIKYGEALGDFQVIPTFFSIDTLHLVHSKANLVTFVDEESGCSVEFHGTTLHTKHGFLTTGTVSDIKFLDTHGDLMLDLGGDKFDVKDLTKAAHKGGFSGLLDEVVGQNDRLTGSTHSDYMIAGAGNDFLLGDDGDDWLIGEKGNDKLKGGEGHDTFFSGHGAGKDVITDFDPSTWNPDDPEHSGDPHGQFHQDLIGIGQHDTYTLVQQGADTIVNFGHGDSVRLMNINMNLIDSSDFYTF